MTTDEFRKLSAVAAILIPHDQAELSLHSPGRLDVLRSRAWTTATHGPKSTGAPLRKAMLGD